MTRTRVLAAAVVMAALLGACTDDPPGEQPTSEPSVALRVTTGQGAGNLDTAERTELESAIGEVLSGYVVGAFLGDFPRDDFIRSFGDFTSRAAQYATGHIGVLTAAPVKEATDVRATRLDARLSFLVVGRDAISATAAVRFEFEATMPDGGTQAVSLRGRLMLEQGPDGWVVFGYDVRSDDGAAQSGELS
jgi:hypothetical protein